MPETAGFPPSASPCALIYLLLAFFIFPPTWRNIQFFWANNFDTYLFSDKKCPVKIWAKSVTYGSTKSKSYMESPWYSLFWWRYCKFDTKLDITFVRVNQSVRNFKWLFFPKVNIIWSVLLYLYIIWLH